MSPRRRHPEGWTRCRGKMSPHRVEDDGTLRVAQVAVNALSAWNSRCRNQCRDDPACSSKFLWVDRAAPGIVVVHPPFILSRPCRSSAAGAVPLVVMTAQTGPPPGRNEPCRCGSGRKYKHCCLPKDDAKAAAARAKAAAEKPPAPSSQAPSSMPKRAPTHQTDQPWKATSTRGFVPRSRTPRKMGGS